MLFVVKLALASDPSLASQTPSVQNMSLSEVLESSAVVVYGTITEVRNEVWMGPVTFGPTLIWQIQVDEELLGHVESSVMDLVVTLEYPLDTTVGDRVFVMANLQKLYHATHEASSADRFDAIPFYEDLLVPTVRGSLYFEAAQVTDDGILFRGWDASDFQHGAAWLPANRKEISALSLDQVVDRVRQGIQAGEYSGRTVPGALSTEGSAQ